MSSRPGAASLWRVASLLLLALALQPSLPASSVHAAEPALSETAAAVLAAVRARDAAALTRLGERVHNPWWAVDELLGAGQPKAAKLLAAVVQGEDAPALRARATRPPTDKPALRAAVARAEAALAAGDVEAVLLAVEKLKLKPSSFVALRAALAKARALEVLDRMAEARQAYADVAIRARRVGWSPAEELRGLVAPSEALDKQERFHALLPIRRRILTLWQIVGDADAVALAGADVAGSLIQLSRAREGLPYLRRARAWLSTRDDDASRLSEALIEVSLCMALTQTGDFASALRHGERARDTIEKLGAPPDVAYACRELGNAYAAFGDVHHALDQYKRGLEALPKDGGGVLAERLYLRLARGVALQESGRLDDALVDLEAVRTDLVKQPSRRARIVTLISLGEAAEKRGAWGKAVLLHNEALMAARGDAELEAFACVRLGDAHAHRGAARNAQKLAQAQAAYERARKLAEALEHDELLALAHLGLGEVYMARGKPKRALAAARTASARLEAMTRGLAASETVRARGQTDRARVFTLGVRAAAAAEDPAALFEMLERSRARVLLASLGGRQRLRGRALPPALLRQEQEARARVAATLEAYRELRRRRRPRTVLRPAHAAVGRARTALLEVTRRIERDHGRVSSASTARPVALDDVRAQLPAQTALVLYALAEPASYALVVLPSGARIEQLKGNALLAQYSEALVAYDAQEDLSDWKKRITDLRQAVLAPLKLPTDVRSVLVSPEGPLTRVPWPVLVDPEAKEQRVVALVPSASVWAATAEHAKRSGAGRLALGNPVYEGRTARTALAVYLRGRPLPALPKTADEVVAITRSKTERLLGAQATESALRAKLRSKRRLESVHFACHGVLDHKEPFLSALALTPDGVDDGFLTALEVFTLRLNTDLAVLSACNTGRGKSMPGEGLVGLTGAFMAAGAPRVIASLWKVPDEQTRALMVRFYEEWTKPNTSTAIALRRAQAHVRLTSPHPYFWAAWVLWGHPD